VAQAHSAELDDQARTARARARREAAARARRRRKRLRVAIPLVVLVAAAGVAAQALLPEGGESPAACAEAGPPEDCLQALSDVAAAQRALADGRVFYARNDFTTVTYIGADGRPTARPAAAAYAVTRTVPEELWLAPDGSGRLAYGDEGPPTPAGPADERAWRAAGAPDLEDLVGPPQRLEPQEFDAGELDSALLATATPLSALPREPDELGAYLRDQGTGTGVTTLLRYPLTPPDLRAALFDVMATVPEARSLGTLRDGAGRAAAAIALPRDANGGENILAFDPRTSQLLAQGSADGDGGVRWTTVYGIATAAVDAVEDRS
jgi:hypothetical protein